MKRLLILAALLAGAAHAEFWDGNVLHQRLNSSGSVERSIGLGYVMGVFDAMHGVMHCAPANVTAGQINDMVKNFLDNTPAVRHFSADSLVVRVLRTSWPCAERNNSGRGA